MEKISNILKKEQMYYEDLFLAIDEVKVKGDVFILKSDGEISMNTIMITYPTSNFEMIRHDNIDIKDAVLAALKDYSSNFSIKK